MEGLKQYISNYHLPFNKDMYLSFNLPYSKDKNQEIPWKDYKPNGIMNMHFYWQTEEETKTVLDDKLFLMLESFIVTQNDYEWKMYIWVGNEYTLNLFNTDKKFQTIISRYNNIIVKEFKIEDEIVKLPESINKDGLVELVKSLYHCRAADAVRLISIINYGGMYCDADTFFLKSFAPLFKYDFCYTWEKEDYFTHAICHFKQDSKYLIAMINNGIKNKTFLQYVITRYSMPEYFGLTIYPCFIFDALWNKEVDHTPIYGDNIEGDIFDNFFKDFNEIGGQRIFTYKDFLPNSYSYDWHGRWWLDKNDNSYFYYFLREFDNILELNDIE